MLFKSSCLAFAAVAALATASLAAPNPARPHARITLRQATATALAAFPGWVVEHELEREDGGSGLRYSFVIRNGAVTHEVGVDAVTGRVLENAVEGLNAD